MELENRMEEIDSTNEELKRLAAKDAVHGTVLLADYQTVTVVDIRYMASSLLDQYVDFTDADVLFLYCTSMFNAGATLK